MLPGVTKWWNGIARHLDVTNPAATEWFKDSLKKLQVRGPKHLCVYISLRMENSLHLIFDSVSHCRSKIENSK